MKYRDYLELIGLNTLHNWCSFVLKKSCSSAFKLLKEMSQTYMTGLFKSALRAHTAAPSSELLTVTLRKKPHLSVSWTRWPAAVTFLWQSLRVNLKLFIEWQEEVKRCKTIVNPSLCLCVLQYQGGTVITLYSILYYNMLLVTIQSHLLSSNR